MYSDNERNLDGDGVQEYEFVPIEPMNSRNMSKEMEEFIAMYCMMGIMPMQRGNPMGFITPMPWIMDEEDNEFKVFDEEEDLRGSANEDLELLDNDIKTAQGYPGYNYLKVDRIVNRIERNNPGIFRFLESKGIPYMRARNFVRRIVRLTLMYS